jgi:hypothetical protein
MQLFLKLFAPHLQWFYHCFDRIVINGYLSYFTCEINVAWFFRQVCHKPKVTKEVLTERTRVYQAWVAAYARNHDLPLEWSQKGVRKEDLVRPRQQRMIRQNRFGVYYYILQSMEQGWTFRVLPPKYAAADPNLQFVRKHRSRFTHYYFYIHDEVAGPMVLRVGSFLPFPVTAYLNGHNFIERELLRQKVPFGKDDNRFVSVADSTALQKAADGLDPKTLQQRIDYWALMVGPKFSAQERLACNGLHRLYAVSQIEYCRNFIFKRHRPIRSIFQRSCELGLYLWTADRIAVLFGQQRRLKTISGKWQNVLERIDHGQQVFRTYYKNSFLKQYEKARTFLRQEIVCNNLKDFALKKTLPHWQPMRERFQQITDRFAQTQAEHLNVHGQFDVLARLAKPLIQGKTKVAGIKLENTRLMRLLELLMQGAGGHFRKWTTAQLHQALLDAYDLKPKDYALTQLRYDLRKLRLHGLIERVPKSYAYRFTDKGTKLSILLLQLRKRLYGPLAFGLFRSRPQPESMPDSRFEKAYLKVENAIDETIALMAA